MNTFVCKAFLAICLMVFPLLLNAQINRDTCSDRFEEAQELYEEGQLRQVLSTLQYCYEPSSRRKEDIYTLSALTYKFLDQDDKAQEKMLSLLNIDPFYQFDQNIPELEYMEASIAVYPKTILAIKGGGFLFSSPVIMDRNPLASVEVLDEGFGLQSGEPIGFTFEGSIGRALSPKGPFINIGLGVSRYSYRYSARYGGVLNPEGNTDIVDITFREKHWWLHVPIFMQHFIGIREDDFKRRFYLPYIKYGIALDLLDSPTAAWVAPQVAYNGFDDGTAQVFDDLNISPLRNNINFSLTAAIGVMGRVRSNTVFVELGYSHLLGNLVNSDHNNTELVETINTDLHYGGFDFQLSNLALIVGVSHLVFKAEPKKTRSMFN